MHMARQQRGYIFVAPSGSIFYAVAIHLADIVVDVR